jgi:hypothetical protein
MNGYKKDAKDIVGTTDSCTPSFALESQRRALAQGQQVTIRGRQVDGTHPALGDCEFVEVGPSTAIPVTVSSLAAEFKENTEAANKKYTHEKSVVLRAKVVAVGVTEWKHTRWTITDVGGEGVKIDAYPVHPESNEKLREELRQVKASDVLVLMCQAYDGVNTASLRQCVILREPPAGVKLPGEK